MARAERLAQLDERRVEMEAEYRALLIAALERCAGGSWGLFGHNDERWTMKAWQAQLEELADVADQIESARERLGLSSFELHAEFLSARGRPDPSAVGEPKQAKAWLAKLALMKT